MDTDIKLPLNLKGTTVEIVFFYKNSYSFFHMDFESSWTDFFISVLRLKELVKNSESHRLQIKLLLSKPCPVI